MHRTSERPPIGAFARDAINVLSYGGFQFVRYALEFFLFSFNELFGQDSDVIF